MDTLDELQGAIELLTSAERADLTLWLCNQWKESRVEEPAAAYKASAGLPHMSVDEYLAFEETTDIPHEYVAGGVFAMSGTTVRHGALMTNIAGAFHNHLQGGPGRTFSAGIKVRMKVNNDDIFYCPDIMVACEPFNMNDKYLRDPRLIVEVLSPSTESIDRREKALHYRHIESLEEYVLVAQRTAEFTVYRRRQNWQPEILTSFDATAELQSIKLLLPLSSVYEGVF